MRRTSSMFPPYLSGLMGGDEEKDEKIISELENWLDDYSKKSV